MESRSRSTLWFLLAGLAAIFLLSIHFRVAEFRAWEREPERFFAGDVPIAGTDSYLYFRYAREAQQGIDRGERDPLRRFPSGFELQRRPLLSEVIARVSNWTGLDVYRAGIWTGMLTAGLFVFPLGLYFYRLGAPLAGLWGAFIGCFGASYSLRTALHRVDTDAGNQFLLWTIAFCVLEAGLRQGRRARLAMAACAGLGANLFCLWYGQPAFVLVFGVALLGFLAARRFPLHGLAIAGGLYFVCANPLNLVSAVSDLHAFLLRILLGGAEDPNAVLGVLRFPSVLVEITELRPLPFLVGIEVAAGALPLGLLGLAGFAAFAWRERAALLPLLPLLALAGLGLVSGERFLMYLGPFLGVGCGWLVGLALAPIGAGRLGERGLAFAGVAPLALLLMVLPASGFSPPSVSVELIRSLQGMTEFLPPESAIAHRWPHGYLISAVTGAATFNDGEDPDPVVEQLIDRGLTDSDPSVLHDILGFLAAHGRSGVEIAALKSGSYAELMAAMHGAEAPPEHPLHLLLSTHTLRSFGSSWWKGRWDFENGEGRREGYDVRECRGDSNELVCSKQDKPDLRIDLARGTLNGRPSIAHFVRVAGGEVVEERSYDASSALWLQLIESPDDAPDTLHALKAEVFASNFNQMFVLGRFDASRFGQIVNDFPIARLYRVLPTQPAPAARKPISRTHPVGSLFWSPQGALVAESPTLETQRQMR